MKHFATVLVALLAFEQTHGKNLFRWKYDDHRYTPEEEKQLMARLGDFTLVHTFEQWTFTPPADGSWPEELNNNQTCNLECGEHHHFKRVFDELVKKIDINSESENDVPWITSIVFPLLDCLIVNPLGSEHITPDKTTNIEFERMKKGEDFELTPYASTNKCNKVVFMQLFDFNAARAMKCAKESGQYKQVVDLWEYWLDAAWKNLGMMSTTVYRDTKCGKNEDCSLYFARDFGFKMQSKSDLLVIASCAKFFSVWGKETHDTFKTFHSLTDGNTEVKEDDRKDLRNKMKGKPGWDQRRNFTKLVHNDGFWTCVEKFEYDVPAAMEESKKFIGFEKKRHLISDKCHKQVQQEFDDILKIWNGAFSLKMTSVFLSVGTVVFFLF